MGSWSPNYWVSKISLVGFCWLLLVGLLISSSSRCRSSRALLMGQTILRHHEEVVIGNEDKKQKKHKEEEIVYNPELDLNFMMSKRKVPNGHDPIHNNKRPPGQA